MQKMFNVLIQYIGGAQLTFDTDTRGVLLIDQMLAKRFNKNKFYSITTYLGSELHGSVDIRKRDILYVKTKIFGDKNGSTTSKTAR